MKILLLDLQYRFYKANEYLAHMMQDPITEANMKSIADETHRLWCREKIQ